MKRNSFFSRIRSYFKGKNDGRYLAFILAEIHRHHPHVIEHLLHKALKLPRQSLKGMVLVPEFAYTKGRKADLALLEHEDSDEARVLIEIKYHDALSEGQRNDYLAWERKDPTNRNFLVLSRATLFESGATTLTWTQAATELRKIRKQSDLATALIEHLNEEGIVMENVDQQALRGFLLRLLCPYRGSGQVSGNIDGPQAFGQLMSNVKLLSGRFNPLFKDAWQHSGKGAVDATGTKNASIDFEVENHLKSDDVEKILSSDRKGIAVLDSARNGGKVYVFARHALGSGDDWLRVAYGFEIDIKPGAQRHMPTVHFSTWAVGAHLQEQITARKCINFNIVTTKAEASIGKLDRLVCQQMTDVLEQLRSESLSARQRPAIKRLLKSIHSKCAEEAAVLE